MVLTHAVVHRGLDALTGTSRLLAGWVEGHGWRWMEGRRRRVNAGDVAPNQLRVRDGKGQQAG